MTISDLLRQSVEKNGGINSCTVDTSVEASLLTVMIGLKILVKEGKAFDVKNARGHQHSNKWTKERKKENFKFGWVVFSCLNVLLLRRLGMCKESINAPAIFTNVNNSIVDSFCQFLLQTALSRRLNAIGSYKNSKQRQRKKMCGRDWGLWEKETCMYCGSMRHVE